MSVPAEQSESTPTQLLRLAAQELNARSSTGTYGDPCGECGLTGAQDDALADLLEWHADMAEDAACPESVAVARAVLEVK